MQKVHGYLQGFDSKPARCRDQGHWGYQERSLSLSHTLRGHCALAYRLHLFYLTTTTSTPSTPRHHCHRRHCSLEVRMPDHDESTPLLVTSTSSTNKMSSSTSATYWRVGALYGAAAVCLGAFGAHGLKSKISDPAKIASWNTAAHYQVNMLHNSLVSSFFN